MREFGGWGSPISGFSCRFRGFSRDLAVGRGSGVRASGISDFQGLETHCRGHWLK